MRSRTLVLALTAAAVAAPASADVSQRAPDGWGPSVVVGERLPASYETRPRAAFDTTGAASVFWDGESNQGGTHPAARTWSPGAGWGGLVRAPYGVGGEAGYQMAADEAGTVHLASFSRWGNPLGMGYSERPAGGQWTGQEFLSTSMPAYWTHVGLLGVHPSGATCLEWNTSASGGQNPGTSRVAERPARGEWSTPVVVAARPFEGFVTAGRSGCRDRVWRDGTTLRVARRAAGGGWTTADSPSTQDVVALSGAFTDAADTTTMAWVDVEEGKRVVRTSQRTGTGAWQPAVRHSWGDADPASATLAVSPDGTRVVGWLSGEQAIVRVAGPGGPWGDPHVVNPPGQPIERRATTIKVAAGPGGTAAVQWVGEYTGGRLFAAVRLPDGSWTGSHDMGVDSNSYTSVFAVAVDGEGNAVSAWGSEGGMMARLFDAAPPVLGALNAPATATTGAEWRAAIAASDPQTGVARIAWDFGDGAFAEGPAVGHAFAQPGPHTVTVTARDGAGNTTRRTIVVEAVAPPVTPTPSAPAAPTTPASTPTAPTPSRTGTVASTGEPGPAAVVTVRPLTPSVRLTRVSLAGRVLRVTGRATARTPVNVRIACSVGRPRVVSRRAIVPRGPFTHAFRLPRSAARPGVCRVRVAVGARVVLARTVIVRR